VTEVLTELAKHASSVIWGGFAFFVLWLFREPLAKRLNEVAGFKAVGVELSFVEVKLAGAAAEANRNNMVVASTLQKRVQVTRADRERVLRRAERSRAVLDGKRILWIDDIVTNNRKERELLEGLGLKLEQVQSSAVAEQSLADGGGGYDLILSDITRPDSPKAGLEFLEQYRLRPQKQKVPLILYISVRDENQPLPLGAFGLTNRPDELLHLVIDALERAG
jgi:CheY-like chemotaxis protein